MRAHHLKKAINKSAQDDDVMDLPNQFGINHKDQLLNFFNSGGDFGFINKMKHAKVIPFFFKWLIHTRPKGPSEWNKESIVVDILEQFFGDEVENISPGWEQDEADMRWWIWTKINEHPSNNVTENTSPVTEVYMMTPTNNASAGMTQWAYDDSHKKNAMELTPFNINYTTEVYDMGDHIRVFVMVDNKPVFYLGLIKFLDGYKSGVVASEKEAQGQGMGAKIYIAASDSLRKPIYSDSTQTDASRIGIWKKLINTNRVVGYDQRSKQDLPLVKDNVSVNDIQPIYNKLKNNQPTPGGRERTRLLKFLPEDKETLTPPSINIGDEVKVGKWKNSKAIVKGFKKDDHNQPVLKTNKGDKKLFNLRLSKLIDEGRENKPPSTKREWTYKDRGGDRLFKSYINGKWRLHSTNDKPAVIQRDGTKKWYRNGELHRDNNDQPAIIYANGSKHWYRNGERHRDNDQSVRGRDILPKPRNKLLVKDWKIIIKQINNFPGKIEKLALFTKLATTTDTTLVLRWLIGEIDEYDPGPEPRKLMDLLAKLSDYYIGNGAVSIDDLYYEIEEENGAYYDYENPDYDSIKAELWYEIDMMGKD